ncbi:hypothetical protein CFR74_14055 [Novacetimonas hansenii]|nr:hypothetical protein CFR74_14055 [Novacetimonas hansenii]
MIVMKQDRQWKDSNMKPIRLVPVLAMAGALCACVGPGGPGGYGGNYYGGYDYYSGYGGYGGYYTRDY